MKVEGFPIGNNQEPGGGLRALKARQERGAQQVAAAAEAMRQAEALREAIQAKQRTRPLGEGAITEAPLSPDSPLLDAIIVLNNREPSPQRGDVGSGKSAYSGLDPEALGAKAGQISPGGRAGNLGSRENPVVVGQSSQAGLAAVQHRIGPQ